MAEIYNVVLHLNESQMKVFVGTIENCGVLNGLSVGFRNLGHEVTSFVKQRDQFFEDIKYDYDLSTIRSPSLFKSTPIFRSLEFRGRHLFCEQVLQPKLFKEFLSNDIFIFTGSSILRSQADLALLKKLGKRIVFVFLGSEARNYKAFNQQYPDVHLPWPETHIKDDLNAKLIFIRRIEYYADTIHALPDISGLFLRSYYPTYVPYFVEDKPHKVPDNKVPRIIHAPSNRNIKGTMQIMATLERLKAEGLQFELKIIEKMPNQVVVQELLNADILIDQIFLHYPSMFSTEGMAMGCAVAMHSYDENPLFSPPVCNVNEHNLYDQLKLLIDDRNYRLRLANAGREFVKNNNSPEIVASKILEGVLHENRDRKIQSTFFVDNFINTSGRAISKEAKRMTTDVLKKYFSQDQFELISAKLKERELL